MSGKIWLSGLNVTFVPVLLALPITFRSDAFFPRSNSMWCTFPSRATSTSSHSDSALTTLPPTPRGFPDVHPRPSPHVLDPLQPPDHSLVVRIFHRPRVRRRSICRLHNILFSHLF